MDSPSFTLDGWDDLDFDDDDEPFPPVGDRVLSGATGSVLGIVDSDADDSPEWPSSPTTAATTVATPSVFGVAPTPGLPSPGPAVQLQASSMPAAAATTRMAESPIASAGPASRTSPQPPAAAAASATVAASQVPTPAVEASSQALHFTAKGVVKSPQGIQPATSGPMSLPTVSSPCPAPHSQQPNKTQVQSLQASVLQSPPAIQPTPNLLFTASPAPFASRPWNPAQSPTGDQRQVDDSLSYFDSFGSGKDENAGRNGSTNNWGNTKECGTEDLAGPHVSPAIDSAVVTSTPSGAPKPGPVPSQQPAADMATMSFAVAVSEDVGMLRPCAEVPPAAALGSGALPDTDPELRPSIGSNVTPQGDAAIYGEDVAGEMLLNVTKTAAGLPSGVAAPPPPQPHSPHHDDEPAWREVSFSSSPFLAASAMSGSWGTVSLTAASAVGTGVSFQLLPPPGKVSEGFELPGGGAASEDMTQRKDYPPRPYAAPRNAEEAARARLSPEAVLAGVLNGSDRDAEPGDGADGREFFFAVSPRAAQQVANEQRLLSTSVQAAAVQSPQGTFTALGATGATSSPQVEEDGEACSGLAGPSPSADSDIISALGVASVPSPPPRRSGSGSGMLSRTPSRRHRLSVSTSFRERGVDQDRSSDIDSELCITGKELEPIQSAEAAPDGQLPAVPPSAPLATDELTAWTSTASEALLAGATGCTATAAQPSASGFMGFSSEGFPSGRDTVEEDLVTSTFTPGSFNATMESSLDADLAQALTEAESTGGRAGASAALRARPGISRLYRTSIASSATATPSELAAFDDAFDELMADSFDTETEPRAPSSPQQLQHLQQQQRLTFGNGVDAGGPVPLSSGFFIAARNPFGPSDSGQQAPGDAEDIFNSLASASPAAGPPMAAGIQGKHEPLQYTVAGGSHSYLFGVPSNVSDTVADGSGSAGGATSGALGLTHFHEASRPLFDSPVPSPRDVDLQEAAKASAISPNPPVAAFPPAPVTTYREVAGGVSALFGGDAGQDEDEDDVFAAPLGAPSPDSAAAPVPPPANASALQQRQQQNTNQQQFSQSPVPTPSFSETSGQAEWAQRGGHWQQPLASVVQRQWSQAQQQQPQWPQGQQQQLEQPQWPYGVGIHQATAAEDEGSLFFDSLAAASGPTGGTTISGGATLSVLPGANWTEVHASAAPDGAVAPASTATVLATGIARPPAADDGSAFFDSLEEQQPSVPASVPSAPSRTKAQEQWGQAPPAFSQSTTATQQQKYQAQEQAQVLQVQTQHQQMSPPGATQAVQQQAPGSRSADPLFQAPGWGRTSPVRYDNAVSHAQDDGVGFFDRPGGNEEVELTSGAAAAVAGASAEILTPFFPPSDEQQVMPTQLGEQQGKISPPPPQQQQQPQEQPSPPHQQPTPLFGQQSPSEASARRFDGSDFFDNLQDGTEADEATGEIAAQQVKQQQQQDPPVASTSSEATAEASTASAAQPGCSRPGAAPPIWIGQQQTTAYPGFAQQQPYNMPGYGAHSGQQQPPSFSQPGYGWQSASQQPTYGQGYTQYYGQAHGQPTWQSQTAAHQTQSQQNPINPPRSQMQALAHTSIASGAALQAPATTAAMAAPAPAVATSDAATATAGTMAGGPASHQAASVFTDGSTQARVQFDIAASRGVPGQGQGQTYVGHEPQGTSPNPQAQPQGQLQAKGQDGQVGPQQAQGPGVGLSAAAAAAAVPDQQPVSSGGAAHHPDQAQHGVEHQHWQVLEHSGAAPVPEESEHGQDQQRHGQGTQAAVVKGLTDGAGDIAAVDSVKAASSEVLVMTEEEVQAAAVVAATSAWEAAGGYSLRDASELYQRFYAYYYYYYQQQQQVQKQQLEQQQGARQQADSQEQQNSAAIRQQTRPQEPKEQQEYQQQQVRVQEQPPPAASHSSFIQPEAPPVAVEPWATATGQEQLQRPVPQSEAGSRADHNKHLRQQQHHHHHPDHHYHRQHQHIQHYHQHHEQTHQDAKHQHQHHQQHNYEQAQAQAQAPAASLQGPYAQPQQQHTNVWAGYAAADGGQQATQPAHSQPQPVPGAESSPPHSHWTQYQQISQQQTVAFHPQGAYGQPGTNAAAGHAPYGQQSGYGGANVGSQYGQTYGGIQPPYGGYGQHPTQMMTPGTLYGSDMQQAQVNYLPTTPELARTCPHGRPTHVVFAFGFGGRAVLMRPPAPATDTATMAVFGTPGSLQLMAMAALTPAHLCGIAHPAATSSTGTGSAAAKGDKRGRRGAQGASTTPVFEHLLRHLAGFPGPLGLSTSKDKVVKWLSDHAAACSAEDGAKAPPHSDTHAAGGAGVGGGDSAASVGTTGAAQTRLLWEVLRLMVKHSETGKAKQGWGWLGGQAKDDSSMETELLKLLVKQRLRTHPQHPQPHQQSFHASGLAAAGAGDGANIAETTGAIAAGGNRGPYADDDDGALEGNHAVGGPPVLAAGTSEALQQAAARRMQRFLVLGRKAEALKVATEAGLWGPALLLATAVSPDGRAFQEVAVAMAQSSLLPGTPVRTLALVVAGRPDLVHAAPDDAAEAATSAAAGAPATAVVPSPTRGVSAGGPPPPAFGSAAAIAPSQPSSLMPPAGFYNPMSAANTVAAGGSGSSGSGANAMVRASIGGGDGAPTSSSRMLASWREHLAILLTTRGPADSSEAVVRLGDRLRTEASQVLAAHICYCLSSYPPSLPDAMDFRYSLLGAATASVLQHPLADGALALQRTEVLEWLILRQAASAPGGGGTTAGGGGGALAGAGSTAEAQQMQMWALLPFKLLHAWELVEYGKISEALQYCAAVEAVLRAGGVPLTPIGGQAAPPQQQQHGRVPGGAWLHMTELQLRRLQDRLMHFAQANAINLHQRSESTITKMGRFLDGTINKLLWGGEQVDGTAMPGGGSAASAAGGGTTGAGATSGADGAASGARPAGPQVVMGGPCVQAMSLGPVSPWLLDHQAHPQGPGVHSGAGYAGPFSADGCITHSSSTAALAAAADGGVNAAWYGSNITCSVPAPPPPRTSFTGATVPPAPRSVPGGTLPGYGYEASMGGGFGGGGNGTGAAAAGDGNVPGAEGAPLQPRQQPLGHRRIVSALDLPPHSLGQLLQPPGPPGAEPPSMSASASGVSPATDSAMAGALGLFGDKSKTDRKKQVAGGAKGGTSKHPGSPPARNNSSTTRWLVNPLRLLGGRKGGAGGADGDAPKKGSLGEENQFYYDETRKRWVMRGQEDAVMEEDQPPAPPTMLGWTAAGTANGPSGPGPQGGPSSGPSPYTTPPSSIPGGNPGDLVNSSLMAGPTSAMPTQSFQRGKGIHARYVNIFGGGGGLVSSGSSSALQSAAASPPSTFFVPPPPPPLQPGEAEAFAQADGSVAISGDSGQSYGAAPDQPDQREQQQQQQQSLQQPLQAPPPALQTHQQPLQQQVFPSLAQDNLGVSAAWVLQPPQSQPTSTLPAAKAQHPQQKPLGLYQPSYSGSASNGYHDGSAAAGTGHISAPSHHSHPFEAGGSQDAASASAPAASYSMPYDSSKGQLSQVSHLQGQVQDTSGSVRSTWMAPHAPGRQLQLQQSLWPAQPLPHPHSHPSSQQPLPQQQQPQEHWQQQTLQQVSPPASIQPLQELQQQQQQAPPGKSDPSTQPGPHAWPPLPPLPSPFLPHQSLQPQGVYAFGTLLSPTAPPVHGAQQRPLQSPPTSLHPTQQSLPKPQSQQQPEEQEQGVSAGEIAKAPQPVMWQQQQQYPVQAAPQQAQMSAPPHPHRAQQAQDLVSYSQQPGGWHNTQQQPHPQQQTTTQQISTSRGVTSQGGSAGGTPPAPQSPQAGQATTAVVDDLLGYGTVGMYERGSASVGQKALGFPSMRSEAGGVAAVYDYASVGAAPIGASAYDPYAAHIAYGSAYGDVYEGYYGVGAAASRQGGFSAGDGDLREVEL